MFFLLNESAFLLPSPLKERASREDECSLVSQPWSLLGTLVAATVIARRTGRADQGLLSQLWPLQIRALDNKRHAADTWLSALPLSQGPLCAGIRPGPDPAQLAGGSS